MHRVTGCVLILVASVWVGGPTLSGRSQASGLTIVVIAGEGAVNIIQQKTAVAPVVEVRDRNDQPVAGAIVRFAIQGGRASFNGARTLTVTTNGAGRAEVTGLTPSGAGAFQMTASAAFQGQTAVVTIAQTNVMTLAHAAAVAGASTGAGGSGGGAAAGRGGGSGGGLPATTIGIIGGAVAGGAFAAREVTGGGTDRTDGGTNRTGGETDREIDVFNGTVSGGLVFTNVGPNATCVSTRSIAGSLKIEVFKEGGGDTLFFDGTHTEVSLGGTATCIPATQPQRLSASGPITGAPSAIVFASTTPGGLSTNVEFRGSVSGNTLTGTLTIELTSQSPGFSGSGSTAIQVNLQK